LGKSGWVTASFGPRDKPPLDLLAFWLAESYRAIAPKKLLDSIAKTEKPMKVKSARQPQVRKRP
jgi:hypothetical protein